MLFVPCMSLRTEQTEIGSGGQATFARLDLNESQSLCIFFLHQALISFSVADESVGRVIIRAAAVWKVTRAGCSVHSTHLSVNSFLPEVPPSGTSFLSLSESNAVSVYKTVSSCLHLLHVNSWNLPFVGAVFWYIFVLFAGHTLRNKAPC